MKYIIVSFIFLMGSFVFASENDPLDNIAPEMASKAVQLFRADPVGDNAMGYLSVVARFADRSNDVLVVIDVNYFPDMLSTIESESRQRLLGAYIAGNVESQLINKVKLNQPIDGVR